MSLLTQKFEQLAGKKALVPFITAGHPKPELTVSAMHALVANGADVIELGIPFSDPMADGEVIQLSSESAIAQGVGLNDVLSMVSSFRENDTTTPVLLMGYLNPIECFGYSEFVKQANACGINGVLLVDSPPEESEQLLKLLAEKNMHQIFLVAPTTTDERIKYIMQSATGFIYYVALKGVTGSADLDSESVNKDVLKLKALGELPVAVGFGVKDAASATAVAEQADAVVIGSALVKLLGNCVDEKSVVSTIESFLKPIRIALNSL
ncbi:tryptophan synthase subunit alpha [Marinicella rhabdoformis]|uniref:tryptophan synthase subunit alpha n=1 Tax=Marinicella rhabdoformis TaxID=2580566 RepID=UPI0012AEC86D|nr:tryptophan synthase subunit alpha [Marinicella rhabdoformis]